MTKTSRAILWTRGFLTVLIQVCAVLLASDVARNLIGEVWLLGISCASAAAGALLGFLDRSLSQHQMGEEDTLDIKATTANVSASAVNEAPPEENMGAAAST